MVPVRWIDRGKGRGIPTTLETSPGIGGSMTKQDVFNPQRSTELSSSAFINLEWTPREEKS